MTVPELNLCSDKVWEYWRNGVKLQTAFNHVTKGWEQSDKARLRSKMIERHGAVWRALKC